MCTTHTLGVCVCVWEECDGMRRVTVASVMPHARSVQDKREDAKANTGQEERERERERERLEERHQSGKACLHAAVSKGCKAKPGSF